MNTRPTQRRRNPSRPSPEKLPGAIEPAPVNQKVMEEFWARVAEHKQRGAAVVPLPAAWQMLLVPALHGGMVGWCAVLRGTAHDVARCPVSPLEGPRILYGSLGSRSIGNARLCARHGRRGCRHGQRGWQGRGHRADTRAHGQPQRRRRGDPRSVSRDLAGRIRGSGRRLRRIPARRLRRAAADALAHAAHSRLAGASDAAGGTMRAQRSAPEGAEAPRWPVRKTNAQQLENCWRPTFRSWRRT